MPYTSPKGGEIIEHSIKLGFLTADNKAISITIPRANPAVTGAEVRSAMNRILNANIIVTRTGEPYVIDKAELVATQEYEYEL